MIVIGVVSWRHSGKRRKFRKVSLRFKIETKRESGRATGNNRKHREIKSLSHSGVNGGYNRRKLFIPL